MKFRNISLVAILFILLFVGDKKVESARILGIFNVPSKSHSILGYELFKELVRRGHEVTKSFSDGK